jgi:hypothetical protein
MGRLPAESVDVLAGEMTDADRGRRRARPLFHAAFVFAALAWMATFVIGVHSSERNGVVASWIAIFPTTFGIGGLVALNNGVAGLRSLGIAFAAGAAGTACLWLFFEGIWPSL